MRSSLFVNSRKFCLLLKLNRCHKWRLHLMTTITYMKLIIAWRFSKTKYANHNFLIFRHIWIIKLLERRETCFGKWKKTRLYTNVHSCGKVQLKSKSFFKGKDCLYLALLGFRLFHAFKPHFNSILHSWIPSIFFRAARNDFIAMKRTGKLEQILILRAVKKSFDRIWWKTLSSFSSTVRIPRINEVPLSNIIENRKTADTAKSIFDAADVACFLSELSKNWNFNTKKRMESNGSIERTYYILLPKMWVYFISILKRLCIRSFLFKAFDLVEVLRGTIWCPDDKKHLLPRQRITNLKANIFGHNLYDSYIMQSIKTSCIRFEKI